MTAPDRGAGNPSATGELPSEAEIAVLEALALQGEDVLARFPSGVAAFHTRLLFVDPGRAFVLIQASADTTANAALLAGPRASLHAESGEWRIDFTAEGPQPAVHEGARAVRLAFPRSVSITRRRLQERVRIPPQSSLRCVGYLGGKVCFAGTVIDVSEGGIGMMREFSDVALGPGTLLAGYRLEHPGKEPVIVDLQVRYTETTTLADGAPGLKVGCRFLQLPPETLALVGELAGKQS